MNYASFFTPFQYRGLHLKNRFVMAPMTRAASPDGIPTQAVADYYARRAAGEVGLILTEGTVIDRPASKNEKDIPNFYGTAALSAWKNVVDHVHAQQGVIAPQLWHTGDAPGMSGWTPAAPIENPSTMSVSDIEATIAAFANAAKSAKEAGFDAIELHGAHGYLIDEFFWDKTNSRTDDYGGKTIKERSRFATAIVKAIRAAAGPDLVIILRVSQWKATDYNAKLAHNPKEMEDWIIPLADAGVDIFHASQRRYWEPQFEGSDLNLAGWIKKVSGQPTITVGSVGLSGDVMGAFSGENSDVVTDMRELERRFERGDFDLVAVGRSILHDPNWVKKVREQQFDQLKPFDAASMRTLY
ncbi:NADH:flavin oxidoreductase [Chitinophaga sp. ARDCPP14]|uniref:NADH:flavin oxidoreductase n=1 Tax=Chitinophaga sp. ARDCPP14 TaxID=3391139 RepID=UPI003F51B0F0